MQYPDTHQTDHTDDYFGTPVPDPYRWLEQLDSAETNAWVAAQNEVTFGYLAQLPGRDQIRTRLTQLWNYERYGVPQPEGEWLYFTRNDGLQNQAVLYAQRDAPGSPAEVLLDPNTFSADGTTALTGLYFSADHHYLTYATSAGGSDWQRLNVLDLRTRQPLPDELDWVKFSGAAWTQAGFYYSSYGAPEAGENGLAARNEFHKVYFHQLGTPQASDQLVYEDPALPLVSHYAGVSDDERFLLIHRANGTYGTRLAVRDLRDPAQADTFITIGSSFDFDTSAIGNVGGRLLLYTDYRAPRFRVVAVDPQQPDEAHWQDVIPEADYKLEGVSHVGGKLIASYLKDASSLVKVFSEQGEFENDVLLPGLGTASGFGGYRDATSVYYAFTSFTFPTTIYRYDLASGQSTLFRAPQVDVNPADYETRQVFYPSKDGTPVPMFITHRRDLALTGCLPTYLYAYGGFNVSVTPGFSPARLLWLENGGVLAVANLRGGGEYGEAWHRAGMRESKQNVFDDFVAAAEYLQAQGYTDAAHLTIAGGSNGGLLVGAVMTQRPDLCRVALPAVGVLDMLRFQRFTIGHAWVPEYGSAEASREEFEYLQAYSPLHNLRPAAYPATLVTTADHDDRVVPAHSFKFTAALQQATTGPYPTLIRVDVNAGHGAGKSTRLQIGEWTDVFAFTYANLDARL
ncbi:prolyl oligopeptidase family protein [uncultured Hymenobacter sp.]|uniref:prolyl oligopeptidase family serine peptidase n=1 Tax=uncultured Hymenobacter sp. TaxID=170016 RepID=UPI0035C95675